MQTLLTNQGIAELRGGNTVAGRVTLMQALAAGEPAAPIWYALALAADSSDERRIYLTKALDADPLHEDARRDLAQLVATPNSVAPSTLLSTPSPAAPAKKKTSLMSALFIAALALGACMFFNAVTNRANTPSAAPRLTATSASRPTTAAVAPANSTANASVYATKVSTALKNLATGLGGLGISMTTPQPGDQEWVVQVALYTVMVEQGHADLEAITPIPADAKDLHAAILRATRDCDASMKLLRRGMDGQNLAQIQGATDLMNSCTAKLDDAKPLLETFVAAHS